MPFFLALALALALALNLNLNPAFKKNDEIKSKIKIKKGQEGVRGGD
jgi:hypothetical protein